jgi:hypothetical protein
MNPKHTTKAVKILFKYCTIGLQPILQYWGGHVGVCVRTSYFVRTMLRCPDVTDRPDCLGPPDTHTERTAAIYSKQSHQLLTSQILRDCA